MSPLSSFVQALHDSSCARNSNFDCQNGQREDVRYSLETAWRHALAELSSVSSHGGAGAAAIDAATRDRWFERLWQLHTEPVRHYHTAVHLQEMIFYLTLHMEQGNSNTAESSQEQCGNTSNVQSSIVLAIFFHDAVYDVHSNCNEEDSAKLFQEFALEAKLSPFMTEKIVEYILATKQHRIPDHINENDFSLASSNYPLALFLELDMSVLGKEEAAYMNYAGLIRLEYHHVPEKVYCEARANILETFLQNPIYGTTAMKQAFEIRARSNLQKEIDLLHQGIIPAKSN